MKEMYIEKLKKGENFIVEKLNEKEIWKCNGEDKYEVEVHEEGRFGFAGMEMSKREAIAWIKYDSTIS